MPHRIIGLTGALLGLLALPATASAVPTLRAPLKPCYATTGTPEAPVVEAVQLSAVGFTPNARVALSVDGQPVPGGTELQVDADGALGALTPLEAPAPYIEQGTRTFTLILSELGNPANVVSATAKTTALRVSVRPGSAPPASRVRFSGTGFTADKPVYAHYVYYRRNPFRVPDAHGRPSRTVELERPSGDCGRFDVRRPQIPVDDPELGFWLIQFDQRRRYRQTTRTAFPLLIELRRVQN